MARESRLQYRIQGCPTNGTKEEPAEAKMRHHTDYRDLKMTVGRGEVGGPEQLRSVCTHSTVLFLCFLTRDPASLPPPPQLPPFSVNSGTVYSSRMGGGGVGGGGGGIFCF